MFDVSSGGGLRLRFSTDVDHFRSRKIHHFLGRIPSHLQHRRELILAKGKHKPAYIIRILIDTSENTAAMKTTNAALLLLLSTAMTANAFVPPSSSSLTSTARGARTSLDSSIVTDRRLGKFYSRLYMSTAVEAGTLTQQTLDELEA